MFSLDWTTIHHHDKTSVQYISNQNYIQSLQFPTSGTRLPFWMYMANRTAQTDTRPIETNNAPGQILRQIGRVIYLLNLPHRYACFRLRGDEPLQQTTTIIATETWFNWYWRCCRAPPSSSSSVSSVPVHAETFPCTDCCQLGHLDTCWTLWSRMYHSRQCPVAFISGLSHMAGHMTRLPSRNYNNFSWVLEKPHKTFGSFSVGFSVKNFSRLQ